MLTPAGPAECIGSPFAESRDLDPSRCAKCRQTISLVQINGKTLAVEPVAGVMARRFIVLDMHRCPKTRSART